MLHSLYCVKDLVQGYCMSSGSSWDISLHRRQKDEGRGQVLDPVVGGNVLPKLLVFIV